MASKRLNQGIRESIITKIVKDTFSDRKKALKENHKEIYEGIYWHITTPNFREIAAANPLWFPQCMMINIHHVKTFQGERKPIPFSLLTFRGSEQVQIEEDELSPRWKESVKLHIKEKSLIEKQEQSLKSKIREIVHSVSTYKQLRELWPEVLNYYDLEDETKIFLPATVNPKELNAMIKELKQ